MAKNKGYTMIEMIIVIAIMGILSGLAFVSFGIIKSARRSTAVNTLDSQIGSCLLQSKALTDAGSGGNQLGMVIEQRSDSNHNTYGIMIGYLNAATGELSSIDDPTVKLDVNKDEDCVAILPREVESIVYTPSTNDTTPSQGSLNGTGRYVIQFVKSDGSTKYGGGKYELRYTSKGSLSTYATVYLDRMSGNHYYK